MFYCIIFRTVDFVQLNLNIVDFFHSFLNKICGIFQLCYRLRQKTEICKDVAQVRFQHLQFELLHIYCNVAI
jgi:hypothetical protein